MIPILGTADEGPPREYRVEYFVLGLVACSYSRY
jgi:hypothetical protein